MTVRAGVEQNTWAHVDYTAAVRSASAHARKILPYIAAALLVAITILLAVSCKGSTVAFRSDSTVSTLQTEVANTPAKRAQGLAGRTSLPPESGMLFDYKGEVDIPFWMKDTTIPLSIAFIDADGRVLAVRDMKPLDPNPVKPDAKYRYAVEANQGWFRSHNVKPGSRALL